MLTKDSIELSHKRRKFADEALIATTTVALTISLLIAATVVSIGIARADTLGSELFPAALNHCLVMPGLDPGIRDDSEPTQ